MSSRSRRLAGIQFVDVPPLLPEKLPRMDIAVFVGFAPAGPLHTPVAVEDAAQFAALFGDDLRLAWDAAAGEHGTAQLGPGIRAFFRNGGRRCWVIRVGGVPARNGSDVPESAPETSVFPIPGLAWTENGALQPAFAPARSPGTWFDSFQSATALTTRPLPLLAWAPASVQLAATAEPDIVAGDLLRLSFFAEAAEAYLLVNSVVAEPASPPRLGIERYTVNTRPLGRVTWLSPAELLEASPFVAAWRRRPMHMETTAADVVLPDSPPLESTFASRLSVSPEFLPPPGALLQLTEGENPIYFIVDRIEAKPALGSPPAETSEAIGRAFTFSADMPVTAFTSVPNAEKLTFELRVQRGDGAAARLSDLGFAPEHPRYWNALPADDALFGTSETRSAAAAATTDTRQSDLVAEASNPRFALAGDESSACFLPIGMGALFDPWMAAENTGRDPLVREGLETFSSALFLDPRLQGSVTAALLPDADFLRYQLRDAPRLRGIHAALGIEEATLIAVPDATHRAWRPTAPGEPASPLPSGPVSHPRWWHFLPCDPPASPPPDVQGPERGQFLDCSLRVVATPRIADVEGPDGSGTYRLKWSTPDADAEFILEEAAQPDFRDAVERIRTKATTHTFLAREPGAYYHRVRAEAEGESSDWSNGVVVHIGIAERWELENTGDFSEGTVLDVHRALLRLCAARADLVGILSLPGHWRADEALAYASTLKSGTPGNGDVLPLGDGENHAFSYAALYHPWVLEREPPSPVVRRPPDGTVTGAIAQRSLARGAWIAPANHPLAGALGLTPSILPAQHLDLLLAQVNLLRQEPHGILALSADTLSADPDLRPLNVRRLLILLRRAALRLGNTYVFEPNDPTLRRLVRGAFESLLQRLFMRGAFAGATADTSYRVVLEEPVNTAQTMDRGQFFVELKVAPALPMSFLTIRLVQIGEQATAIEMI